MYTVIRTDSMSGTKQPADLVSIRFYGATGAEAAVENGTIIELGNIVSGTRDVFSAVAAAPATQDTSPNLAKLAIVAGVEVDYDERKRNLADYINEAGKNVRAYILRDANIFSVTAEGFVGTLPTSANVAAGTATVGIGAGGKISTATTGLGECIAIEAEGRYTYYVIRVAKSE